MHATLAPPSTVGATADAASTAGTFAGTVARKIPDRGSFLASSVSVSREQAESARQLTHTHSPAAVFSTASTPSNAAAAAVDDQPAAPAPLDVPVTPRDVRYCSFALCCLNPLTQVSSMGEAQATSPVGSLGYTALAKRTPRFHLAPAVPKEPSSSWAAALPSAEARVCRVQSC